MMRAAEPEDADDEDRQADIDPALGVEAEHRFAGGDAVGGAFGMARDGGEEKQHPARSLTPARRARRRWRYRHRGAIGRAQCRERVCQYVLRLVGAGTLKKKRSNRKKQ